MTRFQWLTSIGIVGAVFLLWVALFGRLFKPRPYAILKSVGGTLHAFSPDGRVLATRHDNGIRLWDPASGGQHACKSVDAPLRAVRFAPDGSFVAVIDDNGGLQVWDQEKRQQVLLGPHIVDHGEFGFDSRGRRLWCRGYLEPKSPSEPGMNVVRIIDLLKGEVEVELTNTAGPAVFAPSGRKLATRGRYSADIGFEFKVWDTASWRLLRTMQWKGVYFSHLLFSPDETELVAITGWVSGSDKMTLMNWNIVTGEESTRPLDLTRPLPKDAPVFRADGGILALSQWGRQPFDQDNNPLLWMRRPPEHYHGPAFLLSAPTVVSTDGTILAGFVSACRIGALDLKNGVELTEFDPLPEPVAETPPLRYPGTYDIDRSQRLTFIPHSHKLALLFSPIDHRTDELEWWQEVDYELNPAFRPIESEFELRIFDATTGRREFRLPNVQDVLFAGNGQSFAVLRPDGAVHLWKMPPRPPVVLIFVLAALHTLLILAPCWCFARRRAVAEEGT